ncbi:growth inhibitor [Thiovulum sp. ES]|nr:growth inhibitor [Thiovulum sp. ES]
MRQKEIWIVNLDPTVGSEIKKKRPAVIVNGDEIGKLPLKIIAPITDFKPHYIAVPWFVKIEPHRQNGLKKISVIDTFQVRSVDEQRLTEKIGEVSESEMEKVKEALKKVFEM